MFRPINYLCYHGLVFLVSFSCCDSLNSFGVTITDYRKREKKKGSAPGRNQTHDTQIIRVVLYLHATYFRITTTMCSTASTAIVLVKLVVWKGQSRNQKEHLDSFQPEDPRKNCSLAFISCFDLSWLRDCKSGFASLKNWNVMGLKPTIIHLWTDL